MGLVTARRAYGSGSIREVRPGVFILRWRTGTDPFTGKPRQRQETFEGGRKAAQKRLADLVATAGRTANTSATVGDLVAAWLPTAKLSDNGRAAYEYALRHLPAGIERLPARSLTPPILVALHAQLIDQGVGAPTVRKLHTALSSACRTGLEWGWLDRNPCRGIRLPSVTPRHYVIPTPDHLRTMLADADSRPGAWGVWLRLAIASGARRGEVLALRWRHFTPATGRLMVPGTKNAASIRTITLDPDTTAAVIAWRAKVDERAATVGLEVGGDGYIVSDDPTSATPWRLDLATKRLPRLAAAAGCPGARLHDLRHAHATMLLEAGVTARTVADRLGHSRATTTMDMYGHSLAGADTAAAATFGGLFSPPPAPRGRRGIRTTRIARRGTSR